MIQYAQYKRERERKGEKVGDNQLMLICPIVAPVSSYKND